MTQRRAAEVTPGQRVKIYTRLGYAVGLVTMSRESPTLISRGGAVVTPESGKIALPGREIRWRQIDDLGREGAHGGDIVHPDAIVEIR